MARTIDIRLPTGTILLTPPELLPERVVHAEPAGATIALQRLRRDRLALAALRRGWPGLGLPRDARFADPPALLAVVEEAVRRRRLDLHWLPVDTAGDVLRARLPRSALPASVRDWSAGEKAAEALRRVRAARAMRRELDAPLRRLLAAPTLVHALPLILELAAPGGEEELIALAWHVAGVPGLRAMQDFARATVELLPATDAKAIDAGADRYAEALVALGPVFLARLLTRLEARGVVGTAQVTPGRTKPAGSGRSELPALPRGTDPAPGPAPAPAPGQSPPPPPPPPGVPIRPVLPKVTPLPIGQITIPPECDYLKAKRYVVDADPKHFERLRRPVKVEEEIPFKYTFPGDTQESDAISQRIVIAGRRIEIIRPKNAPPYLPTIEELTKALSTLPARELDTIQQVVLSNQPNPNDPYWQQVHNDPNFTTAASGTAGRLTFYPTKKKMDQAYLDSTAIHEGAHSLSSVEWRDPQVAQGWLDAMAADTRSPSRYGDTSPAEDFAEFMVIYRLSKGTPCEETARKLFPNRWAEMSRIVK